MHVPREEESGEQDDEYEELMGSEMELPPQVRCLKLKYKQLKNSGSQFLYTV